MKTKHLLLTALILLTATACIAQKKKKKNRKDREETTALKLYAGPELPAGQVVRLICEPDGKKYAYFIGVNGESIPNNSLMTGPQEILLLPGEHSIKMRFVAKGEIAIPVEPFEAYLFEAGKTYAVKFEYTPGQGSYINGAASTRIRLWIEEPGQPDVLVEETVNGFGKPVD